MDPFHLLFSTRGRIGRLTYFCASVATTVCSKMIVALTEPTSGRMSVTEALACFGVNLLLLYVTVCIAVKRAHDFDKSGWWLLSWTALSFLGIAGFCYSIGTDAALAFATRGKLSLTPMTWVFLLLILVCALQLVVRMLFFPGTDGVNRFGAPDDTDPRFEGRPETRRPTRLETLDAERGRLASAFEPGPGMGMPRSPQPAGLPGSGPPVFGRRGTPRR